MSHHLCTLKFTPLAYKNILSPIHNNTYINNIIILCIIMFYYSGIN